VETENKVPFDDSKPYLLSLEYRPNYLYVFVSGEKDSYDISIRYWREIADECQKSGVKKVLIEEDIKENLSMHDTYRLASEILQLGFFGIRIAFVDRRNEQRQLNQFGETVASNRGLLVRVFNDGKDAENWLSSE
jgi:hypothetical protein